LRLSTTATSQPGVGPPLEDHGDDIVAELGTEWDTIVNLKVHLVVG
jgi:hypothetical protein